MRLIACTLLFALLACGARPAAAERLVVSLSNHRVQITSSFAGEDLVLFGTVEPDSGTTALRKSYDLVVTVTGPRETFRTRRKERVAGIWVNIDLREFVRVPSYLAILSNRPVGEIANAETLRRLQVGLDNFLLPQRIGPDIADTVRDDPYRVAFVRLEGEQGLYRELPNAVTFLTPAVFRAAIPLPAEVPTGSYAIDVKLFSGGAHGGAHQFGAGGDQGRLRAICRRRRARPRPALRHRHRADRAVHRLVRQRGVQEGLGRVLKRSRMSAVVGGLN